jgi:hypothetical protein
VWNDDFTGAANTSPSAANWLLRTGTSYPGGAANWGTGEVETASASTANVYLDGAGKLTIKAIRDGAGNWTSGRLETQRTDFEPLAGQQTRFTAVLRQPDVANGLGYWPGFRATGAAYRGNYNNWPGVGETDIMTDVNGRSQLSQTLHCGTAPDGPCAEYNGRQQRLASCTGCQTGYHEYARSSTAPRPTRRSGSTWTDGRPGSSASRRSASPPGTRPCTTASSCASTWPSAARCRTPSPAAPRPSADTTSGGTLSVDSVSVAGRPAPPRRR